MHSSTPNVFAANIPNPKNIRTGFFVSIIGTMLCREGEGERGGEVERKEKERWRGKRRRGGEREG
jgi:hypothetical protein